MISQLLITLAGLLVGGHALTSSEKSQFTGVTITASGSNYQITATGIPDHATDNFPTNYNPNSIQAQSFSYLIPQTPSKASESTCLPGGPIGFAVNGIPFYSVYTFEGYNAVEGDNAEQFDSCDGHPDQSGSYHYHQRPDCVYGQGDNELVGVAMDGYPIYGPKYGGKTYTASDLDECHGITLDGAYRYVLTADFPYVIGCFTGDIADSSFTNKQSGRDCKKALAAGNALSFSLNVFLFSLMITLLMLS